VKVLFASSGVGLGHITRDFYLSQHMPWAKVTWLTTGTALEYVEAKGARIHPASHELGRMDTAVEDLFKGGRLRLGFGKLLGLYELVKRNTAAIAASLDWDEYDGVVADEFWELLLARPPTRAAFLTDFPRFEAQRGSLSQRLVVPYVNRRLRDALGGFESRIYVGLTSPEGGDFEFYGQIFTHTDSFHPSDGDFVLVNLGGTRAGIRLLKSALPALKKMGLDSRVIGPGEHFVADPLGLVASAKAVLSLAGYGSLIEISRLRKRAIVAPLGGDFEQAQNAKSFMGRAGYRVLSLDRVTGKALRRLLGEVLDEEPEPPAFINAVGGISQRLRILFTGS